MDLSTSIDLSVRECLAKLKVSEAMHIFCFRKIVADFREEKKNLEVALEKAQRVADEPARSAEEVEEVRDWIANANSIALEVQRIDDEINRNRDRRCLSITWCVPDCCRHYKLGKKVSKKTHAMAELQSRRTVTAITRPEDSEALQSTKSAFDQTMEALQSRGTKFIGVYGMGGIGKTTLVTRVGRRCRESNLFDRVVEVLVTQSPNILKIQDQIAKNLDLTFYGESESERATWLRSSLKNKSFKTLIIFDNVWVKLDLAALGIPSRGKQCKIVVASRNQQVCYDMGCVRLIAVNILSKEEVWALFQKASGIEDEVSSELKDVAMKVAAECKGLPLGITILGGALKGKDLEQWKKALEQLMMSSPSRNIKEVVYAILKFSYDSLHDNASKKCLLLCSLFPEDYEIDVEELARYAFGHGLFDGAVDSVDEARCCVQSIVNFLKASGMLLGTREEHCVRMHDVVRDTVQLIACEGDNACMVKTEENLKEWPRKERFKDYTAISLMRNDLKELPNELECPKLQILFLGMNRCLGFEKFSSEGLNALQVLDLSLTSFSRTSARANLFFYDPYLTSQPMQPSLLQFLPNLRTLNLRSRKVAEISVLKRLKNLEILDLSNSPIEELPNEIGELSSLRLLDLSGCLWLARISPNVISKLSLLEELYMGAGSFAGWVEQSSREKQDNASLLELSSLPHLAILSLVFHSTRCLSIDFHFPKLLRYDISMKCAAEKGPYPTSKTLSKSCASDDALLIAFKELLPGVEHLSVECGFRNVIPMMNQNQCRFNHLITLRLRSCRDMDCLVDAEQWSGGVALTNLVELRLEAMSNLRAMCIGKLLSWGGFLLKLRRLHVTRCPKLQAIVENNIVRQLQNLELLKVEKCDGLHEIFQLGEAEGAGLLLSSLRTVKLSFLPKLGCIWRGLTHDVSFQSLTTLKLTSCSTLKNLFTHRLAQRFLQLEFLTIWDCGELEQVVLELEDEEVVEVEQAVVSEVNRPQSAGSFPKLRAVCIKDCQNLKGLFPTIPARHFQKLEEVEIINVNNLKQVFGEDDGSEEVVLENLRSLELVGLKILEISHSGNYQLLKCPSLQVLKVGEFPSMETAIKTTLNSQPKELKILRVENCHKLHTIIPSKMVESSSLDEITVVKCDCVSQVFELDGLVTGPFPLSSKVKMLVLKTLPELRYIWKGPQNLARYENLKSIELYECNALGFVVSPAIAQTLGNLNSIKIHQCHGLEQIIAINAAAQGVDERGACQVDRLLFFPKLHTIEVGECNGLRSLFPIEFARDLQRLEILNVCDASQLVTLFGWVEGEEVPNQEENDGEEEEEEESKKAEMVEEEEEEEEEEEQQQQQEEEERETTEGKVQVGKTIELPELDILVLRKLPSLKRFCSPSYHFKWPTLSLHSMTDCPKLSTTI